MQSSKWEGLPTGATQSMQTIFKDKVLTVKRYTGEGAAFSHPTTQENQIKGTPGYHFPGAKLAHIFL